MAKVYSKFGQIPKGSAGEKITEGCLVLEGGAFRGLYTQGFLDAMMVGDINMQCTIGVSAGALAGINYVAGQIGRAARTNLGFRLDPHYVGTQAFLHSRSILDVSFLTEDRGVLEPFDEERFNRPERRFIAVTTNCRTGETAYFEKGKCSDIMKAVQASASMPLITPMVKIDGVPHLDGGCSCKTPYRWALDQGFEKIIVILTREVGFRKPEKDASLPLKVYHRYPAFAKKVSESDRNYNRECDEIEALHAEGRILRFAPSIPVTVSRLEKDVEKLGELYWLGWNDGNAALGQMREYLGIM